MIKFDVCKLASWRLQMSYVCTWSVTSTSSWSGLEASNTFRPFISLKQIGSVEDGGGSTSSLQAHYLPKHWYKDHWGKGYQSTLQGKSKLCMNTWWQGLSLWAKNTQKQSTPLWTKLLVDILAPLFCDKPNISNNAMRELLKVVSGFLLIIPCLIVLLSSNRGICINQLVRMQWLIAFCRLLIWLQSCRYSVMSDKIDICSLISQCCQGTRNC